MDNSQKTCTVMDTQCGNYRNLLSHFFGKNFVKPSLLLKKLLKSSFYNTTACTVWKNEKFSFTEKIFRQSNSLVNTLISRNFCQKSVRENSRNFHTVRCAVINVKHYLLNISNSFPMMRKLAWSFDCRPLAIKTKDLATLDLTFASSLSFLTLSKNSSTSSLD